MTATGLAGATASGAVRHSAGGGTLTIGEAQTIQDLDPFHLLFYNYPYNNELFSPLVRLDASLHPQAVLAQSWKQTNHGKALILYLRKGVRFANGDPLTSADVEFSVDFAANPVNGANIVGLAKQVTAIQTPNASEVVLRWAQPNPAPFDLLNELYILDAKQGADAATSGNGTGPYRLTSYQPGEEVTMVRRNNYFGTAPKLDKIVVKVFPSEQTEIEALRSGAINMIYDISAPGFASLRGVKGITGGIAGRFGANDVAIQVNVKEVPNVLVRRAISLALDRPAIAHALGGPKATPLCMPFAPGSLGYFASLAKRCTYDLATAKADVEKAGGSFSYTINTSTQLNPTYTQLAEVLQANLAQIGIHLTINNMSSTAYNHANAESEFQLESKPYGRAGDDPSTLFGTAASFYTAGNPSQFVSSAYQAAVDGGASTLDPSQRAKDYKIADEIILNQAFVIPVVAIPTYWVSSTKVTNVQANTDGLLLLDQTTV